jgi:putative transcriptional regulator
MLEIMSPAAVRLRLKELLEDRGITQKQFSELTGISENAISKLIGSPRMIRLDTIELICDKLKIDPGDLIIYEKN